MKAVQMALVLSVLSFASIQSPAFCKSFDIVTERLPNHMEDASASASFQYNGENPELGRAWIELSFYEPSPAGDMPGETRVVRKTVTGLKYDPETAQIIYQESGGAPVVCAKVEKTDFLIFHYQHLNGTGNCHLAVEKIPASSRALETKQDDGYFVKLSPVAKVTLSVRE